MTTIDATPGDLMIKATCDLCRFASDEITFHRHECRRRSPVAAGDREAALFSSDHGSRWPIIASEDWCGDFELDPSKCRCYRIGCGNIAEPDRLHCRTHRGPDQGPGQTFRLTAS